MAKNFTQFQEIDGTKVTDTETGNVTRTSDAAQDMYLVGYASNAPDGERRYTLRSLLYTAAPGDIGLEHVTNESKETMFDDSTFTGSTTADDLVVKGDLTVEGSRVEIETQQHISKIFYVENNNIGIPMQIKQLDAASNFDLFRIYAGEEPAMFVEPTGNSIYPAKFGFNTGPDPYQQGQHFSFVGESSFYGNVSASGMVNGRDMVVDGIKLDTIGTYADRTSLNLENVAAQREAYNVANPSAPVSIKKGFDILEDGDDFKKLPTLSADSPTAEWLSQYVPVTLAPIQKGQDGYGTWDASEQKLLSIEPEADVTGAHSADIKYNEVPDGPWSGNKDTTYVKTTSADTERLEKYDGYNTGIRTVEYNLYGTDDGETLSQQHIVSAYQEGYEYYWSEENDLEYRSTIVPAVTAGVRNKLNAETGKPHETDIGEAILGDVDAESVTAITFTTNDVFVVSAGEVYPGLSTEVNVGGDILHFVEGILVKVDEG